MACWTDRRISTSARIMCSRSTAERDCGFFTTLTATCWPALSLHCDRSCLHAAAKVVKTLVTGLNPLAVKLVLPALYRGMEVTCAWRTKEACIQALGLLAQHAKVETGPCLQVHRSHNTPTTRPQHARNTLTTL